MANAPLVYSKTMPRGQFCVYQSRPEIDFYRVKQTHSSIVLNENNCNELEADGMIGCSSKAMAILTADCLPVLLIGANSHALVHAGWKGLQNEILKNDKILKINPFYAFIGPHISSKNYEVQADFKLNFNIPNAFIERNGKIFFDLLAVAKIQLESTYKNIIVEDSGICTFENEQMHSYRRNKTTERNWNVYIP